ncbi:hypothetical protein SAMN05421665_1821 [Yoonia rosea]|uniref:Arabinogalactan endo-beta-1,4-galactanase n=1 Tax=Yoonia rosea TaxID=287098 RepID=A0A1R3X0V8_9RHOB|nr:hypothetical protein [Yoonia rosea]SIT84262.1 hypothetical protein SAMN05421665_1821 [Yoonia rosea]
MFKRTSILIAILLVLSNFTAATAEPIESLAGTLPASGDYGEVLMAIDEIGAMATSLTLYWDDLQREGEYAADPDWPVIAQAVYPPRQIRIQLTFAVIDTLADRRPAEFRDLAWDDPRVSDGFAALVLEVFSRMPDVDLVSVAIGNEVDGYLADASLDEYGRFFERAREAVHSIRPNVPVTTKVTWSGLRDRPNLLELTERGDALSITWYPMDDKFHFSDPDVALRELSEMAEMANGPWELSEVGYPSNGCGASSSEAQARFHQGLSVAAGMQPNLQLVQRVWSHDISATEVAGYANYYQTNSICFSSFLSSLGLRTASDEHKPAFETLTER